MAFAVPLSQSVSVGRDPACELVLSDRQTSRRHAAFEPESDGWAVIDLGSRHGTFVEGAPVARRRLRDGDAVQIGGTLVTFVADGAAVDIVHQQATAIEPPPGDVSARLRVFHELAQAVSRLDDTEAMAQRLLSAVTSALGAERGLIALSPSAGAAPEIVAELGTGVVVARDLMAAIVDRGEAVVVRDAVPRTMAAQGVRAAMGAPLRARDRIVGLVYVDASERVDRFGADDLEFLVALARLAGAALLGAERCQRAEALIELARPAIAPSILGTSDAIEGLRTDLERYGRAGVPVLIRGESGSGKELVARALHDLSPRRDAPFVAVNCASLPESMIEAELFGHVRGAFTGAARDHRGRLVLADGGTLLLDEVADLRAAGQAALLRVLEDGEVYPVGSERPVQVDVRVLAATHKDLTAEIAAGRFREDLYFRLAVVEVEVPPLRGRGRDVLILAESFRTTAAARHGRPIVGFTPAAVARLVAYRWPGNVRELRHEIERAVLIAAGDRIDEADLSARLRGAAVTASPLKAIPPASLAERFAGLDATERALVTEAMEHAGGNVAGAARLLGISRIMMKRRLDRMQEAPE